MGQVLFTYGTLRPGSRDTELVCGSLYDLGWFPGIVLGGTGLVQVERVIVSDWGLFDAYEGYTPDDPDGSLYIRRPILDGFIYEYNRPVNPSRLILSGDWLDYTQEKRGRHGECFG